MPDKVKWLDKNCHACGKKLNSWDARCSKALTFKNDHCEACIAKIYDVDQGELRSTLEGVFGMRPCMGI